MACGFSGLALAEETAFLGCLREGSVATHLAPFLARRVEALPELRGIRLVDSGRVAQELRGRVPRSAELVPSRVLALGGHLDAASLLLCSYRLEGDSCRIGLERYETLTGTRERVDTLRLGCGERERELDAPLPVPAEGVAPARPAVPVPVLRQGTGAGPLRLEGCRFGEGAVCVGWIPVPAGTPVLFSREGSRFAFDNGLYGSLQDGACSLVEGGAGGCRVTLRIGIGLAHSGPQEFRFFRVRYQVGDESWDWTGMPARLP